MHLSVYVTVLPVCLSVCLCLSVRFVRSVCPCTIVCYTYLRSQNKCSISWGIRTSQSPNAPDLQEKCTNPSGDIVACNGISIGLILKIQPLLSARPPVPVCSCSVPTLVRSPAPLHSLITGNTSLSNPGHADILWVSRQNSSRKKICARLREYVRALREYAPVLRVLRGPGNCENQKSEQTKTVSAQDCQLLLFNHKQHASLRREEKGVVGSEPEILHVWMNDDEFK